MLPFIFFSLVGAFQLIAHPDRPRALVCLPLVFIFLYALLNTLTWTQIRYRMPMHPLLAFYAAVGVLRLKQSLSSGA